MPRVVRAIALSSLVLGCACRALLDLPDVGSELAIDDAGPDTAPPVVIPENDSAPAPNCKTYLPEEGDYAYAPMNSAVRGREVIFFLKNGAEDAMFGNEQSIPPAGQLTFRGRITYTAPNTFLFRADLNGQHYDAFTFVTSPTTGLQVINVTEGLLGIDVSATCNPPVDIIRCVMTPNQPWKGGAAGSFVFNGQRATFGAAVTFTYVDDGLDSLITTAESGESIETFHIKEERTFTDRIGNGQSNEYWFSKTNGLLIQARLRSGVLGSGKVDGITMTPTPDIALEYKGFAEFVVRSTKPVPLVLPDAGRDAKADAKKD